MCAGAGRHMVSVGSSATQAPGQAAFAGRPTAQRDEWARFAPPGFLTRHGQERRLTRDQIVLTQESPGPEVIAVREGVLASYRQRAGGSAEVFGFHYPGDLVFAARASEGGSASLKALVPARVLCFALESLFENLAREPELALGAMKALCGRLMAQQSELFLVGRASFEQRLASFLLDLGRRLGREENGGLWVPLPMRRSEIASYLGLRSETLSRITARWRESGLLLETGRHLLHFPDARQLEAQGLDRNQGRSGPRRE